MVDILFHILGVAALGGCVVLVITVRRLGVSVSLLEEQAAEEKDDFGKSVEKCTELYIESLKRVAELENKLARLEGGAPPEDRPDSLKPLSVSQAVKRALGDRYALIGYPE